MSRPLIFPALHASHAGIWLRDVDGETRAIPKGEAVARAAETPVLLLNAPLAGQRLGYPDLNGLDLLELWAFVHPARFLVPTPKGLAAALAIEGFTGRESDIPALFHAAAERLLATLADPAWPAREGAWTSAQSLHRLRWPWVRWSRPPSPSRARPNAGSSHACPNGRKPPRAPPRAR